MKTASAPNMAETAARLRRAVTRLNRRLRQSSLDGISPTQASMLAAIDTLREPSLGDLATHELIQPPSVTRIARSLEEAGLIQLREDIEDRRCTRVALTAQGRRDLAAIRERKNEFLERQLRALSAEDRRRAVELVDFLERLQEDQ
jgi:DNA-binding MarR family transcriptional regulator